MKFLIKSKDKNIENSIKELVEISNKTFDDLFKKGKIPFIFTAVWNKNKDGTYNIEIPTFNEKGKLPALGKLWLWRWKKDTLKGLKDWFKKHNIKAECEVM